MEERRVIYSVGYQGLELHSFIEILRRNRIDVLVDLRERPYSRQKGFSKGPLSRALSDAGIQYRWMGKRLGGFTVSRNAWLEGCEELAKMAQAQRVVMMCMEADYRRCHRKELAAILGLFHKLNNFNL